jgi:peptidoglycan/xylan/chitin deacetylase (PgdA/CDA1 family)
MRNGIDVRRAALVTTSWDDGHPLDIRLAELLHKYGLLGTFYIPLNYSQVAVMAEDKMRALAAMGMEIGSHTLTHPNLTTLRKHEALHELVASKSRLEDILGQAVVSFCYPAGKFNSRTRSWVVEAGYKLARTTLAFRTESRFDPFYMPVSLQFFHHPRHIAIRHALKEGNVIGLLNWCSLCRMETDPFHLVELVFEHILTNGGLLHIWGHSWEIEQFRLWGALEEALRRIVAVQEVSYLTNSQILGRVQQ